MKISIIKLKRVLFILPFLALLFSSFIKKEADFKVLAFYTAKSDQGHISFGNEANNWFSKMAAKQHFIYESTNDWNRLSSGSLSEYDVVIFLDSRPPTEEQRIAFQQYMENGGSWMGFHFGIFKVYRNLQIFNK